MADDARIIYEQLLAVPDDIYTMPGLLGVLAAALGEHEAAVQHFEAGLEDRSLVLSWLRDPLLDDFREHPGYAEILTRAGLEP